MPAARWHRRIDRRLSPYLRDALDVECERLPLDGTGELTVVSLQIADKFNLFYYFFLCILPPVFLYSFLLLLLNFDCYSPGLLFSFPPACIRFMFQDIFDSFFFFFYLFWKTPPSPSSTQVEHEKQKKNWVEYISILPEGGRLRDLPGEREETVALLFFGCCWLCGNPTSPTGWPRSEIPLHFWRNIGGPSRKICRPKNAGFYPANIVQFSVSVMIWSIDSSSDWSGRKRCGRAC